MTITPQQGFNKDDLSKSDIPALGDSQAQTKYKEDLEAAKKAEEAKKAEQNQSSESKDEKKN